MQTYGIENWLGPMFVAMVEGVPKEVIMGRLGKDEKNIFLGCTILRGLHENATLRRNDNGEQQEATDKLG